VNAIFPGEDYLGGWRIYSRNALTDVHLEGTNSLVHAPACAGLPFALIAAYSKGSGTWIGGRRVGLGLDPLLAFTLTYSSWGPLDTSGRATVKVPEWLRAMGGPAVALLILDPNAPQGIRAITDSRLVESRK